MINSVCAAGLIPPQITYKTGGPYSLKMFFSDAGLVFCSSCRAGGGEYKKLQTGAPDANNVYFMAVWFD